MVREAALPIRAPQRGGTSDRSWDVLAKNILAMTIINLIISTSSWAVRSSVDIAKSIRNNFKRKEMVRTMQKFLLLLEEHRKDMDTVVYRNLKSIIHKTLFTTGDRMPGIGPEVVGILQRIDPRYAARLHDVWYKLANNRPLSEEDLKFLLQAGKEARRTAQSTRVSGKGNQSA